MPPNWATGRFEWSLKTDPRGCESSPGGRPQYRPCLMYVQVFVLLISLVLLFSWCQNNWVINGYLGNHHISVAFDEMRTRQVSSLPWLYLKKSHLLSVVSTWSEGSEEESCCKKKAVRVKTMSKNLNIFQSIHAVFSQSQMKTKLSPTWPQLYSWCDF